MSMKCVSFAVKYIICFIIDAIYGFMYCFIKTIIPSFFAFFYHICLFMLDRAFDVMLTNVGNLTTVGHYIAVSVCNHKITWKNHHPSISVCTYNRVFII